MLLTLRNCVHVQPLATTRHRGIIVHTPHHVSYRRTIIGIECKASASVDLGDFRGLRALAAAAGKRLQHGVLIYSGEHVLPFKVENRKFFAVPIGLFLTADDGGKAVAQTEPKT